jgi:hypothetical protein
MPHVAGSLLAHSLAWCHVNRLISAGAHCWLCFPLVIISCFTFLAFTVLTRLTHAISPQARQASWGERDFISTLRSALPPMWANNSYVHQAHVEQAQGFIVAYCELQCMHPFDLLPITCMHLLPEQR